MDTFTVLCVISDAQRRDGLVFDIWGLWAKQSQLQPGLYPGTVGHPESQVSCATKTFFSPVKQR